MAELPVPRHDTATRSEVIAGRVGVVVVALIESNCDDSGSLNHEMTPRNLGGGCEVVVVWWSGSSFAQAASICFVRCSTPQSRFQLEWWGHCKPGEA